MSVPSALRAPAPVNQGVIREITSNPHTQFHRFAFRMYALTFYSVTGFARKRCTGVPDISLTEGKTARAGGYHRYRGWRQRARPIARGGKIEHPFL